MEKVVTVDINREIESIIAEPRAEVKANGVKLDGVDDLGRMSAEAVLAQYEAAAKAVEDMGASVKERISKITASLTECDVDMKLIAETAAAIREKGKLVQVQIEEASALSSSIRTACDDFKKKVGL